MRSSTFGVIKNLSEVFKPDISLEIFKRMCLTRYFEFELIKAVKEGLVNYPVYLSSGQESIAAAMSLIIPEYQIVAQHRCHATYLAFGGNPGKLRDELLGLPTGSSGGKAGSNCIQSHENNVTMYGHHGFIGENVPIGVGAALGNGRPTVCFFGDGAAEEDYVFAAMGFAVTHKLPVLFVCEDNDLSILTRVEVRRSWNMADVAKGLGMHSIEVSDDPWTIFIKTKELKNLLPAYINIYTCRANWHVGTGIDNPPEWDRFNMVKNELEIAGLKEQVDEIEEDVQVHMGELWDRKQLLTLSGT